MFSISLSKQKSALERKKCEVEQKRTHVDMSLRKQIADRDFRRSNQS